MLKKITFSFLFCLIINISEIKSQTYLVPVFSKESNSCGYVDLNGDLIIETEFLACLDYSREGTAIATTHGHEYCYLIDKTGQIINPQVKLNIAINRWTNKPFGFNDGMLRVKEDKKWGTINSYGKLSVPIVYDELTEFYGGYAIGKKKMLNFIVSKIGDEKIITIYNITNIKHFSEGLAPVEINKKSYGFIDTLGNLVIKPQFFSVGYFKNGLAWAKTENMKVGFINYAGEWVIKPEFEAARDYDKVSGLAMVKKDGLWGYTDTLNNYTRLGIIKYIYKFSEGLAIKRQGSMLGFINNKGEWIIQPQYFVAKDFKNGYARVKKDDKWGLINQKGEWVIKPIYEYVGNVSIID